MTIPLIGNIPPWLLIFSGAALGWIKSFWNTVWDNTVGRLERMISVKLLVEEADYEEVYRWLSVWAEHYLSKKKITDLSIRKKMTRRANVPTTVSEMRKAPADDYETVPNYGNYWFFWNNKIVEFISRKQDKGGSPSDGYEGNLKMKRSVSIAIYGTRNRETLFKALLEAKEFFDTINPASLKYYTHSSDYWNSGFLPKRSLDTIYLPKDIKTTVVDEIKKFLSSEHIYKELGVPYRLGFLFYGPAGTGKTSFVQALSNELSLPIYYFNMSSINSMETFVELLREMNSGIMLMEDIDCSSGARKSRDGNVLALQTSELLNCIDGILANEGRILIMTTNHIEKLDPALIRAGRVDKKYFFDYANEEEIYTFYNNAKKYFPVPSFSDFLASLPSPCTIADAQGILFRKEEICSPTFSDNG